MNTFAIFKRPLTLDGRIDVFPERFVNETYRQFPSISKAIETAKHGRPWI